PGPAWARGSVPSPHRHGACGLLGGSLRDGAMTARVSRHTTGTRQDGQRRIAHRESCSSAGPPTREDWTMPHTDDTQAAAPPEPRNAVPPTGSQTMQAKPYEGWQKLVKTYAQPDLHKSIWQVINSFGGLILCFGLMCAAFMLVGYWLALLLAIPAAGFLVRVFIIQHDAGHGSFFKSKRWNNIVGAVAGVFTLTPYNFWRKTHAIHHAHHAELEERGIGDVWTM